MYVVCVLVIISAPKKRAIAWSDSEESEAAEEQSVDRVTSHTGSMTGGSDRWAESVQYKGVLTHNLLL